jgi:hypothetical protein
MSPLATAHTELLDAADTVAGEMETDGRVAYLASALRDEFILSEREAGEIAAQYVVEHAP